jgi:hypothetical protein
VSEPIALTERQWEVYEGIRAQQTPAQIAALMGVSTQYVTQLRAELRDLGLIRQRGDLPAHGRYEDVYPWELTSEQPPAYKPALPPKARLRLEYPQETRQDLTVPPIRQVWWGPWSVQGIPMARPDGKAPKDALPEHRVVVVTNLDTGLHYAFVIRVRRPWPQMLTEAMLETVVTSEDMAPMTLVIAAAIGSEAVLTPPTDKEPTQ